MVDTLSTTRTNDFHQMQDQLSEQCREAISGATTYALSSMKSGDHWVGEVRWTATFTALYVYLLQCLNLDLEPDWEALILFLESQQRPDGSYGMSCEHSDDSSICVEVYLALKVLEVAPRSPKMQAAKEFILMCGGMPSVRVFTKKYLAMFGLLS